MIDLKHKKVLVTGSSSMIGIYVCDILEEQQAIVERVGRPETNLMSYESTLHRFMKFTPDYVIHLATHSGNIEFNRKKPADVYFNTTQMGLNVLEIAKSFRVKKIVSVLSSCAIADIKCDYTRPNGLLESDLWNGLPNKTVECHGLAKRNLHAFSRQIYEQHGIPAVCCIINNSFGPNDSFHLEKTKVVGAFIRRFVEAKQNNLPGVVCWGSGNVRRQFIYCKDAAEAIIQVLERYYDVDEPINIPGNMELDIKFLAFEIARIVGYKGKIVWDTSKPDGQLRKALDDTKMRQYFDFKYTPFEKALATTINWYMQNKEYADAKCN